MNMLAIFGDATRYSSHRGDYFGFQYLVIRKPVKRFLKVAIGFSWYG